MNLEVMFFYTLSTFPMAGLKCGARVVGVLDDDGCLSEAVPPRYPFDGGIFKIFVQTSIAIIHTLTLEVSVI